jgi:MerR family transcriptional regulator, copper efflux regulator
MYPHCKLWTVLQGQAATMRISLLAEKSGLSVDTIRFYEKQGLIDSTLVSRQANNYRDYSDATLERLILIQQAKRLGFTLVEIQSWIREFENNQLPAQEKQQILNRKLAEVDERIAELQQVRSYLAMKIERLDQA